MSDQRYLVTARKYRPQRFDEIVAQEHVSETLKNAIRLDRLAHAYLFSGPRGVGKTTAARILAKAINCNAPLGQRDDGEPCRECASCKTFEEGRSLNILEIDAASNNRVEDVRDLRETVLIPPQGSLKKVYIIDEVHMLSNAAFNALLKTLEEPPAHALFIFATTEPNKVLPTILSRCQRFDFRRISVPQIVAHLETICKTESITADEASLMLIAHKGDGALRDSLSAFDQAVSLCGTNLIYAELARAFGVVEIDLFFEVTIAVAEGKNAGLLTLVDRIIRQGYDLQEFLTGLASHLRNMLVARTMSDTSLIEAAESVKRRYESASQAFDEIDLLRMLMVVADGEDKLKTSTLPRLQLELTLLKIASMPGALDVRDALHRLEQLEMNAGEADGAGVETHFPRPSQQDKASQTPAASQAKTTAQESSSAQVADIPPENIPPDPSAPASTNESVSPRPTTPGDSETPSRSSYRELFGTPALRKIDRPDASSQNDTLAGAVHEEVLVAEMPAGEIDEIHAQWANYLTHIKTDRIHVSALLQNARPLDMHAQTLVMSVPDEFHKRMLSSQEDYLLQHLRSLVTASVDRINCVIELTVGEEPTADDPGKEIDPREYMERKRQDNPVIRAIFEEFGGEMVW